MRLLVIRHAIADDAERWAAAGRADGDRRLTRAGRERMRLGAAGLARVVDRVDVLAASPLVRAGETAEIVRRAYGVELQVARVAALAPAKPLKAVLQWLQGQAADATVAVVGHEPQLSRLVSWLLSGEQQRALVRMKEGSACLLAFERVVEPGGATLLWMMKPGQLRMVGTG